MEKSLFLILAALLLARSGTAQAPTTVKIINTERQEVGQATLTDTPVGVIIALALKEKPSGITPGSHAFHIHSVGKCEPPFKSAGEHYNPQKKQHGFLAKDGRHAGDLPNIFVPENGPLTVEFFVSGVRLKEGNSRLIDEDGSALVIHAQKDDYRSSPSGNAGDPVACGAIEASTKAK